MGRVFGSACGSGCLVAMIVVGFMMFAVGLTLGIIGSAMYPGQHKWVLNGEQSPSGCLVDDWYLVATICGSKNRYICYYTTWTVNFLTKPDNDGAQQNVTTNLADNMRGSVFYAQGRGLAKDVGSINPCWYDSTAVARARWTKPNDKPSLGLMIAGWIIFFIGGGLGFLGIVATFNS